MKEGKIIVFAGPSGSGKNTIINYLMEQGLNMRFSISATSRPPRGEEQNGVAYWFLSPEEFRRRIDNGEFIEYCEVFEGRYYGTLKSEVDRQLAEGRNIVADLDVVGTENIKRIYGKQALSVFIQPPSLEVLRQRLTDRGTETPDVIEKRLARAEYELGEAPKFDITIVNDDLSTAQAEALQRVSAYLKDKD